MPRKMALLKEICQRRLKQRWRAGIHAARHPSNTLDRALRHHRVREPQTGEHHLAERAAIEHAIMPVEALQGRQGSAQVAELAIVVVFDNPARRCLRPSQQRHAPCERQRVPEGALMRWRDEREARLRVPFDAALDIDAFFIDGHRDELHAGLGQEAACKQITGVLEPHAVAGARKTAQYQFERRTVATGNEHLVGQTCDATRQAKIGGDMLAQRQITHRIRVGKQSAFAAARTPRNEPAPYLARKCVKRRQPWLQGSRLAAQGDGDRRLACHRLAAG
ncbi:hypothetical protein D9M70_376340 [compost metagenome]